MSVPVSTGVDKLAPWPRLMTVLGLGHGAIFFVPDEWYVRIGLSIDVLGEFFPLVVLNFLNGSNFPVATAVAFFVLPVVNLVCFFLGVRYFWLNRRGLFSVEKERPSVAVLVVIAVVVPAWIFYDLFFLNSRSTLLPWLDAKESRISAVLMISFGMGLVVVYSWLTLFVELWRGCFEREIENGK